MLEVAGRPFLEHTIAHLARFGVQEILLLAGFEGARVQDRYEGARLFGADVSVMVEPEPLGTGGALSFAAARLREQFFLCNGDTFFDADLVPLIRTLDDSEWSAALLLREVESGARYGCVELDAAGAIRTFSEKPEADKPALVNAGCYLIRRDRVLPEIERLPCSIETDIFPKLLARRGLRGVPAEGYFIDIGIPESLAAARDELQERRRRPAAFLDRDGVLNEDAGYTHRPDQLVWMPGALDAVRSLNRAGYYVFVVTNQAGIARGYYDEGAVRRLHLHMQEQLIAHGAHIDAFYFCPHHPDGVVKELAVTCRCRKPGPGLLEQAAQDWPIDLDRSFLVGDKDSDMDAARAFGIDGVRFVPGGPSLLDLVSGEVSRRLRAPQAI
jgi:D-glycero-D-manno-heptose 1,7-bisphosphate phosphatase